METKKSTQPTPQQDDRKNQDNKDGNSGYTNSNTSVNKQNQQQHADDEDVEEKAIEKRPGQGNMTGNSNKNTVNQGKQNDVINEDEDEEPGNSKDYSSQQNKNQGKENSATPKNTLTKK